MCCRYTGLFHDSASVDKLSNPLVLPGLKPSGILSPSRIRQSFTPSVYHFCPFLTALILFFVSCDAVFPLFCPPMSCRASSENCFPFIRDGLPILERLIFLMCSSVKTIPIRPSLIFCLASIV